MSQSPTRDRRRVLLVEDSPDAREALQLLLELEGHEVAVAGDGPQGFEAAMSGRPDVALIDIGLPGFDGFELARRLRAAGSKARLLALTGYGQPEDRDRVVEAGFDGHLVKPVDPDTLARTLLSDG